MQDDTAATAAATPEPGYMTTEFWVTLMTLVLPAVALIFHRDFSNQVQVLSVAAAGIASAVYAIARTFRKTSAEAGARLVASSSPVDVPAAADNDAAFSLAQLNQLSAGMKVITSALAPSENGSLAKSLVIVRQH